MFGRRWLWCSGQVALALALLVCVLPRPAWAWVEATVTSDVVTVDVERSGVATVSHELMLQVRGGPFTGMHLEGVDLDAEPLPDASVQPARTPSPTQPIPVLLEKSDDGRLRIEVDHPKGLRSGTYLFRLRYTTRLLERDGIRARGERVELRWVGPRFEDGLDSAKLIFRLPTAKLPPEVPAPGADPGRLEDELTGVFLSTLRRNADKDELEIVRPHVAKGEPVVWRALASARAFDAFVVPSAPAPALTAAPSESPRDRLAVLLAALGACVGYAALVLGKSRAHRRACEERGARARAWLPLADGYRALVAGPALGLSVLVAALTERATLFGGLIVVALVASAFRTPEALPRLRGPGRWLPLQIEDALGRPRRNPLPGRWLDASCIVGALSLGAVLACLAAGVLVLARFSTYGACCLALGGTALLPLWWTGRARELPETAVRAAQPLLGWLTKRLPRTRELRVSVLGRLPEQQQDPDELRLLVAPRRPVPGLFGIEVGVELCHGAGGTSALPCVLVRVLDGSRAYQALPHAVVWTRGRKPEERVAVLRPVVPTREATLALVRSLLGRLTSSEPKAQSTSSASHTEGQRLVTSKPGKARVPAQATLVA